MEVPLVFNVLWRTFVGPMQRVVKWDKCGNPGVLPPFLAWEGVLATEISDPVITANVDKMGDDVDTVTRSITGVD